MHFYRQHHARYHRNDTQRYVNRYVNRQQNDTRAIKWLSRTLATITIMFCMLVSIGTKYNYHERSNRFPTLSACRQLSFKKKTKQQNKKTRWLTLDYVSSILQTAWLVLFQSVNSQKWSYSISRNLPLLKSLKYWN